ncbi:hypothetical protein D3C78_1380420 [compost metagenome]
MVGVVVFLAGVKGIAGGCVVKPVTTLVALAGQREARRYGGYPGRSLVVVVGVEVVVVDFFELQRWNENGAVAKLDILRLYSPSVDAGSHGQGGCRCCQGILGKFFAHQLGPLFMPRGTCFGRGNCHSKCCGSCFISSGLQ